MAETDECVVSLTATLMRRPRRSWRPWRILAGIGRRQRRFSKLRHLELRHRHIHLSTKVQMPVCRRGQTSKASKCRRTHRFAHPTTMKLGAGTDEDQSVEVMGLTELIHRLQSDASRDSGT